MTTGGGPTARRTGEERSKNLLEEAIRQFGATGYDGTSLESVASACGVRKQTLLYYFPTKEALLEAACLATSTRIAEELNKALLRSRGNQAVTVIRTVFRLADEWPEFPAFIREASRLGPETVSRFAAPLEPLRIRAVKAMKAAMNKGELRRQDPELLLFTLYTAVIGSVTEAGVLHALVGADSGRTTLKKREREVIAFVRAATATPVINTQEAEDSA